MFIYVFLQCLVSTVLAPFYSFLLIEPMKASVSVLHNHFTRSFLSKGGEEFHDYVDEKMQWSLDQHLTNKKGFLVTSVLIATRILGILSLSYCFFFMLVEVEASLQGEALLQDYLYGCLRFYIGVCTHSGRCL